MGWKAAPAWAITRLVATSNTHALCTPGRAWASSTNRSIGCVLDASVAGVVARSGMACIVVPAAGQRA